MMMIMIIWWSSWWWKHCLILRWWRLLKQWDGNEDDNDEENDDYDDNDDNDDDDDYEENEDDYDETFCSRHLHSPPHLWPLPPLLLPLPGNTIIIMVVVVVVVMVMVDGDEGGGDGGGEKDEDWPKFAIIFNNITQQHHPYSHHHQHNFCHLNLGRGRAVLVRGSTSIITKHVFPGCDTLSTLILMSVYLSKKSKISYVPKFKPDREESQRVSDTSRVDQHTAKIIMIIMIIIGCFYRTQVNLGSDLWVRMSGCP